MLTFGNLSWWSQIISANEPARYGSLVAVLKRRVS
jgi:hypothetical protein